MSSYYFPQGGSSTITITNISHSILATTASVPVSANVSLGVTASYAPTSSYAPASGAAGTNKTAELCGPSSVFGSIGVQGPTGSNGTDNVTCPAGTIECTSLNQYLPKLNLSKLRPSGSQFIKVCMEIPPGCTSVTATCPGYLPSGSITPSPTGVTATYPSIP